MEAIRQLEELTVEVATLGITNCELRLAAVLRDLPDSEALARLVALVGDRSEPPVARERALGRLHVSLHRLGSAPWPSPASAQRIA